MSGSIRFQLNGQAKSLAIDRERTLLWVLRVDLGLTGTKCGCGEGLCGACTVLVDDKAVRSCQLTAGDVDGKRVVTIEGLARDGQLHPVQQAFVEHDALQCGFCTPGMIMNACGLLKRNPHPSRAEIIAAMDDNLCRCGAHIRIVQAVQSAARALAGGGR